MILLAKSACSIWQKKMGDADITVWAYANKSENLLSLPCFAKQSFRKVLATDLQMNDQGMKFQLIVDGEDAGLIQTRMVGAFNVSNALAVFACLLAGGKTSRVLKVLSRHCKLFKDVWN